MTIGTLQLARALTDRDLSDQLLARGEERTGHPAVRVLRLAEGRNPTLDAREVRQPCAPKAAFAAPSSRTRSRVSDG